MMNLSEYLHDTIAAVATPTGRGAVAIIRISGDDAFDAVSKIFRSVKNRTRDIALTDTVPTTKDKFRSKKYKKRYFGLIIDKDKIVDEVIVSVYHKPYSFTGEDVVEITCHCSRYIIEEIMQLLLKKARLAKPGEFTQRAFFNNKIDLTQAEAIGDLLNAKTRVSHQAAISQLEGKLNHRIKQLLAQLISYRIELEISIDFTEYLPLTDKYKLLSNLRNYILKLKKLIAAGKEGVLIREGLFVCLAGAPNVGKSSLFNRLLETNRAIVTSTPGTTRDYLEESLSIEGYLVKLVDTAGLRESQENVESIGINISYDVIKKANKVLFIVDGTDSNDDFLLDGIRQKTPAETGIIKLVNKCDLLEDGQIQRYKDLGFHPISVKTGYGIEKLKKMLVAELMAESIDLDEGILTNIRQISAVEKCLEAMEHAVESLDHDLGVEFTAFDLKVAGEALEEIIGRVTDDDLLNKIFSDFCIGK